MEGIAAIKGERERGGGVVENERSKGCFERWGKRQRMLPRKFPDSFNTYPSSFRSSLIVSNAPGLRVDCFYPVPVLLPLARNSRIHGDIDITIHYDYSKLVCQASCSPGKEYSEGN